MAEVSDVQRTLKVRLSEGADPTAMSACEFKEAVRDGQILGDTPVWGNIFTDGDWLVAADLRIFHSASPTPVPLAPKLQALADAQARTDEEGRRMLAELSRREEALNELISVPAQRLDVSCAEAVWILEIEPAFRREEFVIVEDSATTFEVERLQVRRIGRANDPLIEQHQRAVLDRRELPQLARDRRSFEKLLASPASRVNYFVVDGTNYKFQYASRRLNTSSKWQNPTTEQVRESQITTLFGDIVEQAFGDKSECYEILPPVPSLRIVR